MPSNATRSSGGARCAGCRRLRTSPRPWSSSSPSRRATSPAPRSRWTRATRLRPELLASLAARLSEPELPGLEPGVQLLIQRHVRVTYAIVDVERIAHAPGVIALERELLLAQLEGAGELERAHDAQEERPGVVREARAERAPQIAEIEARTCNHRCHAGATLCPGHTHSVHRSIRDS